MSNNKVVLDVKNLTKLYGERKAVDNISFQVKEGVIYGFIGPNGAGKSTTIKMITGLSKITDGDVYICGNSVKKNFEKAIVNVGGIIENPEMYSYLSGMENLKFYASLYKNVSKERINEIVRLVGLEKRINDKVSKYSLGMKQRLGIAQALLHSPRLIILDEPTNGLDVNGIIEIRNLLKSLAHKNNVSIMVSSHILSEMEMLCDEISIISNGKIVGVKTSDDINKKREANTIYYVEVNYPNYAAKILSQKYKCKIKVKGQKLLFNTLAESLPSIISFLVASKLMIYGAGKIDMSLEDEFLSIVGQSKKSTEID